MCLNGINASQKCLMLINIKIEGIILQMILIFPISELAQNYEVPVNVVAMLL